MGLPAERHRISIAEYLRLERTSVDKHEYRDGQMLMMAGGSAIHSLIVANFIGELRQALKGNPCRVYDSNLRVRIPRTALYTYPDLSVLCEPLQRDANDDTGETVINPRVIVEVLSPSTEAYDRGEKFNRYRLLDSLEEYVLVSQFTARVETFYRQPDGTWLLTPIADIENRVPLRSLGVSVSLREIYAGVTFPPPEDESTPRAV